MLRSAAILLAIPLAIVALFVLSPPGTVHWSEQALAAPFASDKGNAWVAPSVTLTASDDATAPQRSRLRLFEGSTELGPAHTAHDLIRKNGQGGFSHWQEKLWFSTSDGSDPNQNGKSYTARAPYVWSTALYIALLLLALPFVAFALFRLLGRWAWLRLVLGIGLAIGIVEVACWIVVRQRLAAAPNQTREWYAHLFEGVPAPLRDQSIIYEPHPFLNYALNPEAKLDDTRQTEPSYRIRRATKPRPRGDVRWRALALGGSTTFGSFLRDGDQVWVQRLERAIRDACGDDVDCINGGVPGYTLLENLVHYALLLEELQPDVVLLYVGINDVTPRLVGELQPDYRNYRVPWREQDHGFPEPGALAASWTYRLLYLQRHLAGRSVVHILQLVAKRLPDPNQWRARLATNGPQVFERKLRLMLDLLKLRGAKVLVLPQYYRARNEADAAFAVGVREHNAICRTLAKRRNLPYLAELESEDTFELDDCFDNCHFNAAGSRKMAELVFEFLKRERVLPARR